MPRYFFHIHDTKSYRDDLGVEFSDLDAAKKHALIFAGAVISDERPTEIWSKPGWSMDVTDSAVGGEGKTLLRLQVRGFEA